MSPAKTDPRFTPIRTGIGRSAPTIFRRVQQHPFLVVARDARRAGREDQLPAVGVDVRREERDALLLGRGLHDRYEPIESLGGDLGALALDQLVGLLEMHEGDRHRAMFRRAATGRDVRAHRGGEAPGDQVGRDDHRFVGERLLLSDRRLPLQEDALALRGAEAPGRQQRGRLRADEDLAGVGVVLHRDGAAPRGPDREQLSMHLTHQEEVEPSRMEAVRHPEVDLRAGNLDPADVAEVSGASAPWHGRPARGDPPLRTGAGARRRRT